MTKKRRSFSGQFKVDVVMDLLTGAKTPGEICRERDITGFPLVSGLNLSKFPTAVHTIAYRRSAKPIQTAHRH